MRISKIETSESYFCSFPTFHPDSPSKIKCYLFDLDHTIIKTKSGSVYPRDKNDWDFFSDDVLNQLKEISNELNTFVCIITNQKNIKKKPEKFDSFQKKIEIIFDIFDKEDIKIGFFVSFEDDYYRKPLTGSFYKIYQYFKKHSKKIDIKKSMYIGDAAGRQGDHSWSDRFYAHNCGISFQTPEQYFLHQTEELPLLPSQSFLECEKNELPVIPIKPNKLFCIFIMGEPASGKSHIAKQLQDIYGGKILETDKIKNKKKLYQKCIESIHHLQNMIVVGTFPQKKDRIEWIQKMKRDDIDIYGIEMNTSKPLVQHMNYFRCELSMGKIPIIPYIVYIMYQKKYQKMELNEGYQKIFQITPCFHFTSKKIQKIFHDYFISP
jgi:bifunctional polynucleotide phosphatase/kinase